MKRLVSLLAILSFSLVLFAHPWKPGHYVIIDTDGGIDDIKAISMLLASPDVRVLGITVSPGALDISMAYKKVKSLLNSYYHEGIPVGVNRLCDFVSPGFKTAMEASWGDENGINVQSAPDADSVINDILNQESTKVSIICLGGLSTVNDALNNIPVFRKQVKEVIWSSPGPDEKSAFNYSIDRKSASKVLKSGIPVNMVKGSGDEIFYNDSLIDDLSSVHTVYASKVASYLRSQQARNHQYSMEGIDEMTVLYLHYPGLFATTSSGGNTVSTPGNTDSLRYKTVEILAGLTVAKNQVIREFPDDPSFYFHDIEPYVTAIINKYGKDEWTSGVIANELHRHLGVFAILGVKMGIRAREYFDTGVDEFTVVSHAGSVPPLSCMNDGLQVSTGATPGHGLLTVDNDPPYSPSAEFTHLNRKIRLTLKPELAKKILDELKEINYVYGLDSNIYWELVRKNTIKYWLDLDRHNIFTIVEMR
jgi:pyrimidine-specific ribonucleoside hydrolase